MNSISKTIKQTDWVLLIFLLLFTNQAVLSLKVVGLLFVFLLRPNLRFGIFKDRLPLFYLLIVLLAAFNLVFNIKEFTPAYLSAFSVGCLFWLFGFLAFHQVKSGIEQKGVSAIYSTMKIYTILNLLASLIQLVQIMLITNRINPYTDLDFPYGMSTGDNIFGIPMQNSYFNMMISCMLALYFLFKRNLLFVILSIISLILVFGNVGTIIFFILMLALFGTGILNSILQYNPSGAGFLRWLQRISPPGRYYLYIPMILLITTFFYAILSPENFSYLKEKLAAKVFANKSNDRRDYRTIIEDQKTDDRVYDMSYFGNLEQEEKNKRDSIKMPTAEVVLKGASVNADQRIDAKNQLTQLYIERLQGKVLSMLETKQFLFSSTRNLLLGAGPVRFSSATAQKMAGFDSSRLFMNVLPHYESPLYRENHKLIIETRKKSSSEYFSNANWPDSFFNQIFGEYGVMGFLLFIVFYVWFFVKRIRYWSYGFWLFLMIIPFAHLTYLFEPLCVIVFFELLMEADITENKLKTVLNDATSPG